MGFIGKKKKKGTPEVSTASLPDIIFTLLFFFMVSAKVKDSSLKVTHVMPKAIDSKKLTSEDKTSTIHIGKPMPKYRSIYGEEPVVQINDQIVSRDNLEELKSWVVTEKQAIPSQFRDKFLINIKADGQIPYSYIDDVKQQLRRADARNVNFDAGTLTYER